MLRVGAGTMPKCFKLTVNLVGPAGTNPFLVVGLMLSLEERCRSFSHPRLVAPECQTNEDD